MAATVIPDPAGIKGIESDPPTRKEIMRAGYQLAKYAALHGAPRRTGKGANSIRGSVDPDDATAALVSWGQKYYYMIFQEEGWSPKPGGPRLPGKHFLAAAFERYRID